MIDNPEQFEDQEYVLHLPYHLAKAEVVNDLAELLTEFNFLEYKIRLVGPQAIIEDFDFFLA